VNAFKLAIIVVGILSGSIVAYACLRYIRQQLHDQSDLDERK
jgi:hypothetical protein